LHLTGNLCGLSQEKITHKISQLTKMFPLADVLPQKMANYSRGNRQKVAFLSALMSDPKLLLVDEPVSGLDPDSITVFGNMLKLFTKEGGAVLLATHILSFGQQYAHKVGVMSKGHIVHEQEVGISVSLAEVYAEKVGQL
jgi:ABC-2 type transport system ATP-binding protein